MLVQEEEAGTPFTAKQHDFLSYASNKEHGISEVSNFDHYYDNEIYNFFTHEEQHPELLKYTQGIVLGASFVSIMSTLLGLGLPVLPELVPNGGGICGMIPDMDLDLFKTKNNF
nr:hypothetical protein [Tanacetum cinerariifolium]